MLNLWDPPFPCPELEELLLQLMSNECWWLSIIVRHWG